MKKLNGKTVVITGATSGIGLACAGKFAENGANLALCARNIEKLESIANGLREKHGIKILTAKADVRRIDDMSSFVALASETFESLDILINNAGLALGLEKFTENLVEDWENMIDTNIKGLLYTTKFALPHLIKSSSGLIINIGSLAGVAAYPNGAVYCATKAAVKFISDGLRQDIVNTKVRVTNLQPGMVETNFSIVRFHGDEEKAANVYKGIKPLSAEDISETALFTALLPAHVQICEMTITPVNQATGGVIYKETL